MNMTSEMKRKEYYMKIKEENFYQKEKLDLHETT